VINILSIRCGLAFAPYLHDSLSEFLRSGGGDSRVVRQGGSGLIMRREGEIIFRFESRDSQLGIDEARHYAATIKFRRDYYDVQRMSDEVVLATVGSDVLLSHPQSEIWLDAATLSRLVSATDEESGQERGSESNGLPDWLNISTGGGRLLLSDQRSGRWVLLGRDHIAELERRHMALPDSNLATARPSPPVIETKGIRVHLQSAFRLIATLERFAVSSEVSGYEEISPGFLLRVAKSTEGIEIKDFDNRVGMNAREARKWAAILRSELERLGAEQIERGGIRTVFAAGPAGRWALQWGDEVFVVASLLEQLREGRTPTRQQQSGFPVIEHADGFLLMLSPDSGACVALDGIEVERLIGKVSSP
jgi:hypothetical protein